MHYFIQIYTGRGATGHAVDGTDAANDAMVSLSAECDWMYSFDSDTKAKEAYSVMEDDHKAKQALGDLLKANGQFEGDEK